MKREEDELIVNLTRENRCWRDHFLKEVFEGDLKFIPETYKHRLVTYFLSIPSESFADPWKEWNKCICVLLQNLGDLS